MKITPILEEKFYHDGRGPELITVVWAHKGTVLKGFEYYNPDDEYSEENIKHVDLEKVEAYSMASEEVHGSILASSETKAAIFKIDESEWLKQFNQRHLSNCSHFQIMFYDEIYDLVCESIRIGKGRMKSKRA